MHVVRWTHLSSVPDPDDEIVPGVKWGRPEWVPSPAYWWSVAQTVDDRDNYASPPGTPLQDVVCFCLLGGFGIRAEINEAAFSALHKRGLLVAGVTESDLERALREPLPVQGRMVRYRFPTQRARRIANALARLANEPTFDTDDIREMRRRLSLIEGIGPKTASWIVRNWLGSDEVAIIDIHLIRACQRMGLFAKSIRLPRDYDDLERRFLLFAERLGVRPSLLDAIMWREMRALTS